MVTVGVPRETSPRERRVALVPSVVPALAEREMRVVVEAGAGLESGHPDGAYAERGARVTESRGDVLGADVVLRVDAVGDLAGLAGERVVAGFCRPLSAPEGVQALASTGATGLAIELLPRITRAQSMDALSSQATVAGYRAVLLAASELPRMFPLMTTAAGTITPARVLVVGTGVAGLQAIATARRLGAVVSAYDVRPAAREQVESLGAKFVELPLDSSGAEDAGGYARERDESFYRRQSELMAEVVAASDVVITTALVPGRAAPVLITRAMLAEMEPGSVIVDLAAEQGGNCESTRPDEVVREAGVAVHGPTNLPAMVPAHASQMYARNLSALLAHLMRDGALRLDTDDQITREILVTRGGEVVHPRVREALSPAPSEPAGATVR